MRRSTRLQDYDSFNAGIGFMLKVYWLIGKTQSLVIFQNTYLNALKI